MTIAIFMNLAGVSSEQYEAVMEALDLDQNPPQGVLLHVASFTGDGLRVVDVWESSDEFDRFNASRLAAAVKHASIDSEPVVEVLAVHNIFAPGLDVLSELGSTSMPESQEEAAEEATEAAAS